MSVQQIPRVSGLSLDDFHSRFVERGEPVVLEDAARDWPAVAKWTLPYLVERAGDSIVELRAIDPRKPGPQRVRMSKNKLRDYFATLPRAVPGDVYLAEQPLKRVFPQLLGDIGTIRYSRSSPAKLSIMLSARSYAPLHYHPELEAVSHQITGQRRFLLIPPSETSKLDPGPVTGPMCNFARRTIAEADIASLSVRALETTLSPGEAIYIPRHFWHAVYGREPLSILLADFFEYTLAAARENPVVDRINLAHESYRQSIAQCTEALGTAVGDEKLPYLELMAACYRGLRDRRNEHSVLVTLVASLPQDADDKRRGMQERLDELAASSESPAM